MATQVGAIKVQIGSQTPKVQSISYGDVITYAANGNFVVSNTTSLISNLDAGTF